MIYSIKCVNSKGVKINSLNLSLSLNQSFDCSKEQYDRNKEIQLLVASNMLSVTVKQQSKLNVVGNRRFPVVREHRVIEIEKKDQKQEPQVNMEELTSNLLSQLGKMLSPEILAKAIAENMPKQQVIVEKTTNGTITGNTVENKSEDLTFIPSNIIDKSITSSSPLSNETKSESSDEISDALSALKALRKANKK